MSFSIRPARRDDVPALLDMIGQLAAHHGDQASTSADALLRDAFASPPWIEILVAEAGARLIGYTVLCPLYRAQFAQRGLDMHHLFAGRLDDMHDRKVDPAVEQRSIRCSRIRGVHQKTNTRKGA